MRGPSADADEGSVASPRRSLQNFQIRPCSAATSVRLIAPIRSRAYSKPPTRMSQAANFTPLILGLQLQRAAYYYYENLDNKPDAMHTELRLMHEGRISITPSYTPRTTSIWRILVLLTELAVMPALAGSHSAISGPISADTRDGSSVGHIEGSVLGGPNRTLVVGASVVAGGYKGTTGPDGRFSIPGVATGTYDVVVTASGYVSTTRSSVTIAANQTKTLSVVIDEDTGQAVHPIVLSVESKYGEFFPIMAGQSISNTYTAHIAWNGTTPGQVNFMAPEMGNIVACASWETGSTVSATFSDMGSAFGASVLPIFKAPLVITAQSADGGKSPSVTLYPWLFAVPEFVGSFPGGELEFATSGQAWKFAISAKIPHEKPWEMKVMVPDAIPFLGGELGLRKTQAELKGSWDSAERVGKIAFTGTSGFDVAKMGSVYGTVGGGLKMVLQDQWDTSGIFIFGIKGTVRGELGILDAMQGIPPLTPFIVPLRAAPYVGPWINERAILYAEVSPELSTESEIILSPAFGWKSTDATFKLELKGGVQAEVWPMKIDAYIAGTPYIVLNVSPTNCVVKEAAVDFVAGFSSEMFGAEFYGGEATFHLILIQPQNILGNQKPLFSPREGNWVLAASSATVSDHITAIRARGGNGCNRFVARAGSGPQALSMPQAPVDPLGMTTASSFILKAYSESRPSLAINGNQRILVFGYDNTNKPDFQSTEIWFSRDTGAGWNTPAPITVDTHLDCSATVAFDAGGRAVAVWQRSNTDSLVVTNQNDLLRSMEIAYAVMDPALGTWSAPLLVTSNNYLDHSPRLAADTNGNIMLAWVANEGNEMIGTTNSPGRIRAVKWNSGTASWGAALDAVNISAGVGVAEFAMAYAGSQGDIVFVKGMDPSGTNAAASDLYRVHYNGVTFAASQRVTDDTSAPVCDAMPEVIYSSDGHLQTVWVRGANLVMCTDLDTNTLQTVCDISHSPGAVGFSLAKNAGNDIYLLWPDFRDGQFDVRYRVYDSGHGVWGEQDGRLTYDTAKEYALSPAFAPDGTLVVAFNRTQMTYTNMQYTATNGVSFSVGNVPVKGDTDIVLLNHSPGSDLQIAGLSLSPSNPAPGSVAQVTVFVANYGDLSQTNLQIALYDGVPGAGGSQVGATYTAPGLVPPQAVISNTWNWSIPAADASHCLYAAADPANRIVESIEGNNTNSLPCVLADVALVRAESRWIVDNRYVFDVFVANTGVVSSDSFGIETRLGGSNGSVLARAEVPGLAAGWTDTWPLEWDATGTTLPTTVWVGLVVTNGMRMEGAPANNETILVVTPPTVGIASAPANLTASPGPRRISLRWLDTTEGEDAFRILRRSGNSNWTETAFVPANVCFAVDTNVLDNTDYTYRVFAANSAGAGPRSAEASAHPLVDADGDGMPDAWEIQYFGSLTNAGAASDTDCDGSPDASEWFAGTDPTNRTSVFALANAQSASSNVFVVQWFTVSNKYYAIGRSTNLLDSVFAPIATGVPATPTVNAHTDRVDGVNQAFYRIEVEP
jgi:hypothetical protein